MSQLNLPFAHDNMQMPALALSPPTHVDNLRSRRKNGGNGINGDTLGICPTLYGKDHRDSLSVIVTTRNRTGSPYYRN